MPKLFPPHAFAVLLATATAAGMALAQQQLPDAGRLLQQTQPAPALPQRQAPKI